MSVTRTVVLMAALLPAMAACGGASASAPGSTVSVVGLWAVHSGVAMTPDCATTTGPGFVLTDTLALRGDGTFSESSVTCVPPTLYPGSVSGTYTFDATTGMVARVGGTPTGPVGSYLPFWGGVRFHSDGNTITIDSGGFWSRVP